MTVGELIKLLQNFHSDTPVIRGDADGSGVSVTDVRTGYFHSASTGDRHFWEDYDYPHGYHDEDYQPTFEAVKIG